MRETVTISLSRDTKKELDAWAKKEHMSRSDLIKDALRKYFAIRKFRAIREQTLPKARAHGILSEEDILRSIS